MDYLTEEEYKEFGFADISEPFSFKQLLPKASDILNGVTRNFYLKNDIEKDNPFRVKQFKKAVGAQIEYFVETKKTTSEGLNSKPTSQTIGDTTVTYGSAKGSGKKETKSLVCPDIYTYLGWTGLLSRGVR